MKYLKNPYVAVVVCMLLYVFMYNYATNNFMRMCSYVPLAVVLAIFFKGVYHAYFKRDK